MSKHILAIDLGTSGPKVALVAATGEILVSIETKDYDRGLAVLEKNRLTTYNDFVDRLMGDRGTDAPAVVK